jgi:signal transduction histidine kinase
VSQDLLLFAQLVVFLTGTVLYGFLVLDLTQQPRAFAGLAMRLLVACLGFWYAGCFVAGLLDILVPGMPERFDTAFGLVRGVAFLASFPLLVHAARDLTSHRQAWAWLVPGYLSLLLFAPAAARAWQARGVPLAETARRLYPWIALHAVASGAIAAWLLLAALRRAEDRRETDFLRWLLAGLGAMEALLAAGALLRPARLARSGVDAMAGGPAGGAPWIEAWWRLSAEISGLVLGLVFLTFVQRYSLLRLSLSRRGVRRFLYVLAAMALLILAGPAVGIAGTDASRRLVAGGVLVALAAAAAATPAEQMARRRFPGLRRLIGRTAGAEEIEALTRRLRTLALSDRELRRVTEEELSRWLGVTARFLAPPPEAAAARRAEAAEPSAEAAAEPSAEAAAEPSAEAAAEPWAEAARAAPPPLWDHLAADPGARTFSRLDAPLPQLAAELDRADLQAVFPLRVAGRLDSILGLAIGNAAAGYEEGEREAVQIVVDQLAAALEMRRLVEARLAAERRMAEHERLSLLGLVSASLAHELKNPLSAMKALAQTVHEELAREHPGGEQAQDLGVIVEQIDRLHAVAREVLSFARSGDGSAAKGLAYDDGREGAADGSEADGGSVELTPLTRLLRSTLYVLRHLARQRGIEIVADAVSEVGNVRGTTAAWQTVLLNLALNAVQHAPAGSEVRIRLERGAGGDDWVTFHTENAGSLDAAVAARLFQPFASSSGSGLGLALVAQRVRELGGEVKLDGSPGRILFEVRVPA